MVVFKIGLRIIVIFANNNLVIFSFVNTLVPDILAEYTSIHPGVYEVMLFNDLRFGGVRNTA